MSDNDDTIFIRKKTEGGAEGMINETALIENGGKF